MAEKQIQAEIESRNEIAKETFEVGLKLKGKISFKAGQYVWVEIPKLLYSDTKGSFRAFSIASSPNDTDTLTIIFRMSDSGFKKTLMESPLGAAVNIIGPFGFFTLPEGEVPNLVFVAGGVAIAPFMSILKFCAEQKIEQKITLLYSNESEEEAAYLSELGELQKQNSNFVFVHKTGKINWDFIRENIAKPEKSLWYVAGPQPMVNDINQALRMHWIKKEKIIFDENHGDDIEKEFDVSDLEKFKLAVESSSNQIIMVDVSGKIEYANLASQQKTGFTLDEMRGQTPRLWGGMMDRDFYKNLWQTIKYDKKPFRGEITNRRKDGSTYVALTRISPILDKNHNLVGFLGTEEDITKEKDIERVRDEFISIASHQLRTPLTAINWNTESLLADKTGKLNATQKKYLEEMHSVSQRMAKLINALLNVSRIELGALKINPEPSDLAALADSVSTELKPAISERKIKLVKNYEGKIAANVDQELMSLILENLLSNAIMYTPPQGHVTLSISREASEIVIKVSDTGYGIPADQQSKIFGRFFRAKNIREKEPEGIGLGLYIVKSVVEQSGGRIWFESEENKGSTFFVAIPIEGMRPKEGSKKLS